MAIENKSIHFKTKATLQGELAKDNISDTNLVFVQDVQEIYTHGSEYPFVNWGKLALDIPEGYTYLASAGKEGAFVDSEGKYIYILK